MTVRSPLGARGPAVVAMAVGAAVTVLGSSLPWVRTGGARRNSYDLFALVERFGYSPDGPAGVALRWWPIVPLITALAVVAAWWGWPRTGGVLGVVAGGYAGGVGLAIGAADVTNAVEIQFGAPVTAAGGALLVLGSLAAVVLGWRAPPAPVT
ncbi:hypothetical protein BH18ACT2_BH18ACT2_19940 [soil metagenome]